MNTKSVAIIQGSINLSQIDKTQIVNGKKGQYVNVTLFVNEESNYGNNVAISQTQSKEQSEAKERKNYIGNAGVKWISKDGTLKLAEKTEVTNSQQNPEREVNVDLPF